MNRHNYSAEVVSNFEILAAFFVNEFYNGLYINAQAKLKLGRINSLTDAYKGNINDYVTGIRHDIYYQKVIKALQSYYSDNTNYSTLTFSQFEDKILGQFIPVEYYRDLKSNEKDVILFNIITVSVERFGKRIIEHKHVKMIIDDHLNEINARIFQDMFIDNLILLREEYYVKFARNASGASEKVDVVVVDKLKEELSKQLKARCEADADKERAINIIKQLTSRIAELEETVKEYKNKLTTNLISNTESATKKVEKMSLGVADVVAVKKSSRGAPATLLASELPPQSPSPQTQVQSAPSPGVQTELALPGDVPKGNSHGDVPSKAVSTLSLAATELPIDDDSSLTDSDSDSEVDDEEMARRQKELLANRKAATTPAPETTDLLMDFGDVWG